MWTKFFDMSSGGSEKTQWSIIVFEAKKKDAIKYANWKWDIHPDNVTCTCCGTDFSASTHETLEQAVEFHLEWGALAGKPAELSLRNDILVVPASELEKTRQQWKNHTITRKGYVWCEY